MNDQITLIGNVATVPERRGSADRPVAGFRLATSRRVFENGQWIDKHTNWYSISAFGQLAEHTLASIEKGQRVIVTGRFTLKEWEKNGKKGVSAEIDADGLGHDLQFGSTTFHRDASRQSPSPEHQHQRDPQESQWADSAPRNPDEAPPFSDRSAVHGLPHETRVEHDDQAERRGQDAPAMAGGSLWPAPMEEPTPF